MNKRDRDRRRGFCSSLPNVDRGDPHVLSRDRASYHLHRHHYNQPHRPNRVHHRSHTAGDVNYQLQTSRRDSQHSRSCRKEYHSSPAFRQDRYYGRESNNRRRRYSEDEVLDSTYSSPKRPRLIEPPSLLRGGSTSNSSSGKRSHSSQHGLLPADKVVPVSLSGTASYAVNETVNTDNPVTYYVSDDSQVVSGTKDLSTLHQVFADTLLQPDKAIPAKCSFLSAQESLDITTPSIKPSSESSVVVVTQVDVEMSLAASGSEGTNERRMANTDEVKLCSENTEHSHDVSSSLQQNKTKTELSLAVSKIDEADTRTLESAVSQEISEGSSGRNDTACVAVGTFSHGEDGPSRAVSDSDSSTSWCDSSTHSLNMGIRPKLHQLLNCSTPSERKVSAVICQDSSFEFTFKKSLVEEDPPLGPSYYHSYAVSVTPTTNFELKGLTSITRQNGQVYVFRGFSVISAISLDHLPPCKFERYGGVYTIELKREPLSNKFTIRGALLFQEYLFVRMCELYDWMESLKPFCKELLFVPNFIREDQDGSCESLSLAEVLLHLMEKHRPLMEISRRTINSLPYGFLATHSEKSPSCVRVDRLEWTSSSKRGSQPTLMIGHLHKSRMRIYHVYQQKKEQSLYGELLQKQAKRKLTIKEHFQMKNLKQSFASTSSSPVSNVLIWIPSDGFCFTGLYYDILQHTSLLPLVSQHIFIQGSLKALQEKLNYQFKDVHLLHRAITHPSSTTLTYNTAEDNIKNMLANGGEERVVYFQKTRPTPSKGIKGMLEAVGRVEEEADRLENNEQLEFLGDAVLEYLCSFHLYHVHPDHTVGQLSVKRQSIVKNRHLSKLAEALKLTSFLLISRKVDFSRLSIEHTCANCVEAILGAVFLDGGLEETDRLFARLAFPDKEGYQGWMVHEEDPLIREYPEGDRHLIQESETLQNMTNLELSTGIEFKHILLLNKAFVHPSSTDVNLTKGHYQRLEFLGDATLQFLVTKFIYHRFPGQHEGNMSALRMSLVCNKQLTSLSKELSFDKYIITSKSEKSNIADSKKILADVVESFLAALTLDQSIAVAEQFLERNLFPKLETVETSQLIDANTRLHQAAVFTCKQQGVKVKLPYYKRFEEGSPGKPAYKIEVHFGKRKIGEARATTVREARSTAAENALQSGFLRIPPYQRSNKQ